MAPALSWATPSRQFDQGRAAGPPRQPAAVLGAVKTNMGYLEGAAGVAGLIKVILALYHNKIPQSLNFSTLNKHIDFGDVDVQIPAKGSVDWPANGPRVAAVSSFGFGGTNSHVVMAARRLPARSPRL
jgi:acyl transferase domain-containing protein